jgi:hypothetical protein
MNQEQTAAVNLAMKLHIRVGNQDSPLLEKEVALPRRLLERYTNEIESEADGAVVFDGERLNPIRPA